VGIDLRNFPDGKGWPLPHRRALAATARGVAARHAARLSSWSRAPDSQAGAGGATAMRVRQVTTVATAGLAAIAPAAESVGSFAPAGPFATLAQDVSRPAQARAVATASAAAPEASLPGTLQAPGTVTPSAAATPGTSPPTAADAEGAPAPVYATRPPSSATLHFELRRGAASGSAVLDWRHDHASYDLALVGTIDGAEALGWVGRGGFDEAGLAPERVVVRCRGRALLAANFQRSADGHERAAGATSGRISLSGPAVEWPLWPGVQDRVSWLLQLASILEAEPGRGLEGSIVVLWLVGACGDAGRWTLQALAPQTLDLPAGRLERALPFVREPQQAHDPRVEVWVDPEPGHLPVRLRFTARPSGDSAEFLLRPAPPR
jgi:hypothetical protein